ncbi:alpha/beta hydrolase family protein [Nocardia thailandica]|uniref:alpha/beta hydrolase family protein n=1 Tax=Nocardia thailandica TaxID=257275 RepID=UPI000693378D|nr:alpha/beta fold hydrolase [Nocardia thailandica]
MGTPRVVVSALLLLAAVLAGCSRAGDAEPAPVAGRWHGTIDAAGQLLVIGVELGADGTGTIDVPAQGIAGAPLADVETAPERVAFRLPDIPGDPGFRGRLLDDAIAGDWRQAGRAFPLTLRRGPIPEVAHPQEPKPPHPYRTEDVAFPSGDLTLAGTLTLPQGAGPFPAVVLITGSGPQNRDEELMGHKPFLLLADTLTRAGYAVLRTDDRGVGGSGGDLDASTYDDLAGDVVRGVAYLRTRPEIDARRIGLFGHSEGGYLAPLAAARPGADIAFAVLMAGPSVVGADVLVEQNRLLLAARGAPPERIDEQVAYLTAWTGLLRAGDLAGARDLARRHNAGLPEDERAPDAVVDALTTPYTAALVAYDPAPALRALRVPVLAFYGDKDLQVPAAQNEAPMRAALSGSPAATVHTFPGLNHLMQPARTGTPAEYATIETTVDPAVLAFVTAWLTQQIPPR